MIMVRENQSSSRGGRKDTVLAAKGLTEIESLERQCVEAQRDRLEITGSTKKGSPNHESSLPTNILVSAGDAVPTLDVADRTSGSFYHSTPSRSN